MTLILCVDDRGGLLFNRRRQSQDRLVRQDMLRLCGEQPLAVSPYTARQFSPEDHLKVTQEPGEEDIFFLEDLPPRPFLERAEKLVLYHWNRVYPGDVHIVLPPQGWRLEEQVEFPGYSHEKITREVYTDETPEHSSSVPAFAGVHAALCLRRDASGER